MSEMYAGILCAVMMLSLCAALHGCLCAFCYKMPRARVLCPLLLIVGFVPLSILISRLDTASSLNGYLWTALASLLFTVVGLAIVLFIAFLLFSLLQQVWSFVRTVFDELMLWQ